MPLRFFLRAWLQNAAKQKVREEVLAAAREQFKKAGATSEGPGAPQAASDCHVGLVFALKIEADGLLDRMETAVSTRGHGFTVRQGVLKGRTTAVVLSGPGYAAAARATEALIVGHRPRWIISAGFAGGLSPELKRYDVLMADELVTGADHRLTIDLRVDPTSLAGLPGIHVGRLLTVDRVIRLPAEKQSLWQKHRALAVDMESFAVAEVCRERKVRFLAVRVINDPASEELPPDVEHLLGQQTYAGKFGAVLGAVWRRPGSVKDMFHLKETADASANRLAKFLGGMVEQL